jgi:hypothetical protein
MGTGVKEPGREADHSHSSNAEAKNGGATPLLPHTSSWSDVSLVKSRGSFITYVILVGKPVGKRPLAKPRRKWANNIKMDLRATE